MKKYGKFFKKAALTAAICFSLSQSVWAMPTGGAVETGADLGTVVLNNLPFEGSVASGDTIATSGPAIINWNAFGIAPGETLNFDTAGGALLNRVTGGNPSEIYGTLTQTGWNPMFLVNPNGILVGSGATIDANQLVLSTLAISDSDFLNGNYVFNAVNGKTEILKINNQARVNLKSLGSDPGRFAAFGKTVEVADGVTFSGMGNELVELAAAETVSGLQYPDITSTANNVVTVKNVDTGSGVSTLDIQGGKIEISDAAIQVADNFYAEAFSSNNGVKDYSAGSGVTIHHANIVSGNELKIAGKTVEIKASAESDGSILAGANDTKVIAAQSGVFNSSTGELTFTMTPVNQVTTNYLRVSRPKTAQILGGNVNLENSEILTRNTENKNDTYIWALPGVIVNYQERDTQPILGGTSGSPSNYAVTLKNTRVVLETSGDKDPSVGIAGGKVALNHANVELTGGNDNGINIYAASSKKDNGMTATSENTIAISDSKLDSKGQRIEMAAGQISIDGSEISAKSTVLVANEQIGFRQENGMPYGLDEKTQGNIAISANSTIPDNAIIDGKRTEAPVNPDSVNPVNPVNPDPAPANLEESRKAGEARMEEAFSKSTDVASLVNNTQTAVKDITDSSDSYAGQMEQFKGVLSVIANQEDLTNAQKTALQNEAIKEFVSDYVPAKQAKAGADNTVTTATNNVGDNAQPQQNQQAGAAGTGNVSVPTTGEAGESPVTGVQEN